jgi:hypothetical protein
MDGWDTRGVEWGRGVVIIEDRMYILTYVIIFWRVKVIYYSGWNSFFWGGKEVLI